MVLVIVMWSACKGNTLIFVCVFRLHPLYTMKPTCCILVTVGLFHKLSYVVKRVSSSTSRRLWKVAGCGHDISSWKNKTKTVLLTPVQLVGLETDIAFDLQKLRSAQRVLQNVGKVFSLLEFIKIHPKDPLKQVFKFVFIINTSFNWVCKALHPFWYVCPYVTYCCCCVNVSRFVWICRFSFVGYVVS